MRRDGCFGDEIYLLGTVMNCRTLHADCQNLGVCTVLDSL